MGDEFSTTRSAAFLVLLEERLPKKTFLHVQSVARLMLTFAAEAGITREQAVTAGLLHDVCKALSKDELAVLAGEYGITEHLDNPNLLHGPVGAEYCRRELGIDDADVLEAIHFHTIGKGEWSTVGCALYLADFAEPLRTMPEATIARELLAREGFGVALRYVAERREEYVREKFTPNRHSLDFFDWIKKSY